MDRRISVSIYKQNKQAGRLILVPHLLMTLYRCAPTSLPPRWLVLGLDVYVFLLKAVGGTPCTCPMLPSCLSCLPMVYAIFMMNQLL